MSILAFSTIFWQWCQYVGVHVNFEVNVFKTFEQCQKMQHWYGHWAGLGCALKRVVSDLPVVGNWVLKWQKRETKTKRGEGHFCVLSLNAVSEVVTRYLAEYVSLILYLMSIDYFIIIHSWHSCNGVTTFVYWIDWNVVKHQRTNSRSQTVEIRHYRVFPVSESVRGKTMYVQSRQ